MALWRYLAGDGPVSLPLPEIQIFGGGVHASRRIDLQDLMVIPMSATSFSEALCVSAEVYRAAGALMHEAGTRFGVADEGGYWPQFASNEDALTMLVRAIERAGYSPGDEVAISLDIAASELVRDGHYRFDLDDRDFDQFRKGLTELSSQFTPFLDSLDRLWRLQRAQADMYREGYQTLLAEHDVPAEKLVARFPRTLANLKTAIRELPHVWIFDNDDLKAPFRQVAVFENGRRVTLTEPVPEWLTPLLA